jgi:hypothetical protein
LDKVCQAAFWLVKDLDLSEPLCEDEPIQIRIEDLIELKKRVMAVIAPERKEK